jgi:hypothetical protein
MSAQAVQAAHAAPQQQTPEREAPAGFSQGAGNAAAAQAVSGGASSDPDADALGLTARFEAQRAIEARVDAAVRRSTADPAGALAALQQILGEPGFDDLPGPLRARVLYDIGGSYQRLEQPHEARMYLEASISGGGLDAGRTERAAEAIRRTRGGAYAGAPGSATPVDEDKARQLQERVTAGIAAGTAGRNAEAVAILNEVYLSADFPGLPRALRGRALFALAAAYQNTGDASRAISGWTEALGSSTMDAEHQARARDNLRLARIGQPAAYDNLGVLLAMIDGATALAGTSPQQGFDMLYRVYRASGFRSLPADQQARVYHNLAALAQRARMHDHARNFWLEALNSGLLDARQAAQGRHYLNQALLNGGPNARPAGTEGENPATPAQTPSQTPAQARPGLRRRPGS